VPRDAVNLSRQPEITHFLTILKDRKSRGRKDEQRQLDYSAVSGGRAICLSDFYRIHSATMVLISFFSDLTAIFNTTPPTASSNCS
jgi:hypothetical protein